jgi:hypothetical protein
LIYKQVVPIGYRQCMVISDTLHKIDESPGMNFDFYIVQIFKNGHSCISNKKISARYYYLTPSASPKLSARGPCNEDYYVGINKIIQK